ncbi:MAG: hypothetical protein IAG13_24045 [Deltaproteobacteria bacterium]|nr:hypothetical protein [Nannocystaceae bacterium]
MALNIRRAKVVLGGVLASMLGSGITSADEAKAPTTAIVKLTVIDETGAQVALGGHTVKWDEKAEVVIDAGDHHHAVALALHRGSAENAVDLAVAWSRDGKTVVDAKKVSAKLGESRKVAAPDGKSAVVFVVETRGQIAVEDVDDPLAGI